jgi:hypothetical protein
MNASYSAVAGGNISPARFVTLSTSSSEPVVTQSAANDAVWGISPKSTRRMALSGWDDGYAAIAGETMAVFGPGDDEALLELGEAVTAAGQYLQAGTDGKGELATTDKDHVGAVALETGAIGDLIKVKPMRFDLAA